MARVPTRFVLAQFERLVAPLFQHHLTFRLFFFSLSVFLTAANKVANVLRRQEEKSL